MTALRVFVEASVLIAVCALTWSAGERVCAHPSPPRETTTPPPHTKYEGEEHMFVHVEGHFSLLTDAPDRSVLAISRGIALRGGYTWGHFGTFVHIERSLWFESELNPILTDGVLNVGAGVDYRFFRDRIRMSFTGGASTLLFDTYFHPAWTTGYFTDLRPGALRWFPLDWLTLEFHPITFTLMSPAMEAPRLIHLEYRSLFTVEFRR